MVSSSIIYLAVAVAPLNWNQDTADQYSLQALHAEILNLKLELNDLAERTDRLRVELDRERLRLERKRIQWEQDVEAKRQILLGLEKENERLLRRQTPLHK